MISYKHLHLFIGYQDRGSDVRGYVMEDGKPYLGADDELPFAILSYAQGIGYGEHLFVDEAGNLSRLDLGKEINMTTDFKYKFPSPVPKESETHSGADVGIFASGT
jgi:alkaline phosphatase